MKDDRGAILITFIVFFTLAGILASTIAYLLQNVPFAIKSIRSVEQSYYLSESGLRYVLMKINEGKDYDELKNYYETEQRTIYIPQEAARSLQRKNFAGNISLRFSKADFHNRRRDMFIHSTAQVEPDTFVESKRQLNAEYNDPNDYKIDFEEEHFNQEADDTDRVWNLTDSFVAKIDEIDDKPSLKLTSDQNKSFALASLNWGKNDKLPDLRLYQFIITKVLSYKIQLKINCYPDNQEGKDFMAGLNFRVMNSKYSYNRERTAYYGVSLFRSAGRQQGNPPCWLDPDSNDCNQHLGTSFLFKGEDEKCKTHPEMCLAPKIPYIIFWVKTENNDNIELIAYCNLKTLNNSSAYIEKLKSHEWGFKDWLNLGVFLKEKEAAGQKLNEIQIGLRVSDKKDWDFPLLRFVKLDESYPGTAITLIDRTLISRDLYDATKTPPDEIGFHALYDNRIFSTFSKYKIYFWDFVLKCHGDYCHDDAERLYVQF